jgi:hypothetical protein
MGQKKQPNKVPIHRKKLGVKPKEDEKYLEMIIDFIDGKVDPADMKEAIIRYKGPEEIGRINDIFSSLYNGKG